MTTRMLAVLVGLVMSGSAYAGVGSRANHLQARINQGERSGELTRPEARRLQVRENHLRREIVRDRLDGPGLTLHERAKINRQENRLSRSVYRQKHDLQRR